MEAIAVGLKGKRGHVVTDRRKEIPPRPVLRKGKKGKNDESGKQMVKEVIREVCGFAPYEKRIMELIRMGTASSRKRAFKFAKRRLGTHKRGLKKRADMEDVVIALRKKQAATTA
eukprot:Selendium_serpulae@DN4353_c0_g1_i1.p1